MPCQIPVAKISRLSLSVGYLNCIERVRCEILISLDVSPHADSKGHSP